jgi:hypothetical protein
MTFLIAAIGLVIALIGLVQVIGYALAGRAFRAIRETTAFKSVAASGTVTTGEALVAKLIAAIPIGFVRNMVAARLEGGVASQGLSAVDEVIDGGRRAAGVLAGAGLVILFASPWIAGWLSQAITGLAGR